MKLTSVVLPFTLALVGCASRIPAQAPSSSAASPPSAQPPARSGFEMTPPPAPEPVVDPNDMCASAKLKYLIGRPKTEIPVPVNVSARRVTCTTCPVTMDFNPYRLNILFDDATGIVNEVKCG